MDLTDVTSENFFKKVSYSSASPSAQDGKIIVSNGLYVQCAIHLRLIEAIEAFRISLN